MPRSDVGQLVAEVSRRAPVLPSACAGGTPSGCALQRAAPGRVQLDMVADSEEYDAEMAHLHKKRGCKREPGSSWTPGLRFRRGICTVAEREKMRRSMLSRRLDRIGLRVEAEKMRRSMLSHRLDRIGLRVEAEKMRRSMLSHRLDRIGLLVEAEKMREGALREGCGSSWAVVSGGVSWAMGSSAGARATCPGGSERETRDGCTIAARSRG